MSRGGWAGQVVGVVLVLLVAGLLLCGCEKEGETEGAAAAQPAGVPAGAPGAAPAGAPAVAPAVAPAAAESGDMGVIWALNRWKKGEKAGAVEQFLALDLKKRPLFPAGTLLGTTNQEFGDATVGSPELVNEKAMQIGAELVTLGELLNHILAEGRSAIAAGNVAKGKRYLSAVLGFCQGVASDPNAFDMIKGEMEGYIKAASEGLALLNK